MGSRSASEGELVDSEIEKATTALPSAKGTSVNRRLRDALSPSPERSPRSPSDSYRSVSRDRSRSPYRANKPVRGEKRTHDDDYHTDRSRQDRGRGGHGHYGDRSGRYDGEYGGYGRGGHLNYDDRDRQGHKRQKTRSRSPPHHQRHQRYEQDARLRGGREEYHRREPSDTNKRQHFVSSREASYSNGYKDHRAEQSYASQQVYTKTPNDGYKSTRFAEQDSTGQPTAIEEEPAIAPPAPVNEALSIEERRKRREAIKAKYKGEAPSLLVQALAGGCASTSTGAASPQQEAATPRSDRSMSPQSTSTPGTPSHDSRAGSPPSFSISNDADLANSNDAMPTSIDGNEPSAADYDPTMDMQEDQARHDLRQQDEMPAAKYDEKTEDDKDVLLPQSVIETTEKPPSKKLQQSSDDMFASDNEDDDMFAPVAPKKTTDADDEIGRAVTVTKAKELDMSLMDDWDDPEGYYRLILGELIDGRYKVQATLGKGMFSSVVRCEDVQTMQLKAIKIVRNNETMIKAGAKEMDILEKLMEADPEDKKHMIRLERSFTHKGHLCMVFENLSINLREVLKKFGRDRGIHLKAVRAYAQQMFLGLSLLRKCHVLHADLKPDNVLVNEERNMLKICDLGSASDASENDITPYLVSRFYRAPEVILGAPYDFAIDMWSIGCTLFELYTGKILFTGRTNNQMLRSMMECRGKFSLKMLKKAEFGAVHFDDQNLNFRSVETDRISGRLVTKLMNFQKPTRDLKSRIMAGAGKGDGKGLPDSELKELNLFVDLLDRCLALNPERRITPAEALKHPFIHRGAGK